MSGDEVAGSVWLRTEDAVPWLEDRDTSGQRLQAVFTSLPDAAETGQSVEEWRDWFLNAAAATMDATVAGRGYAVFYQTDRRVDGHLESKAGMILDAAAGGGLRVLWHKIAVATEGTSLFRPAYTHLIAVGGNLTTAGRATPDVYPRGPKVYPNATDSTSIQVALDFLAGKGVTELCDPFCGSGSIPLHAARDYGMQVTAIDIDPAQTDATIRLLAEHNVPAKEGRRG